MLKNVINEYLVKTSTVVAVDNSGRVGLTGFINWPTEEAESQKDIDDAAVFVEVTTSL